MTRQTRLLEFVIRESYRPATLPMARLAEYLADLSALLGEKDKVHFVALKESSSSIVHAVEYEAIPKVQARIHSARHGDGDPDAVTANKRLNSRLVEDNGFAELRDLGDHKKRLLYFPGVKREVEEVYGPFYEQGQLYGVPISIGGRSKIVNVNLQDGERVYYCEATRDVALQIAPLLFNHKLRVYGTGRYLRDEDAEWEMKNFRISHFDRLDPRPLAETVERLRTITRKIGLDKGIIAKMAGLREE